MKKISIDNGNSFCTIYEAVHGQPWEVIVNAMNDEIKEIVNSEFPSCRKYDFLTRYLELTKENLIIKGEF